MQKLDELEEQKRRLRQRAELKIEVVRDILMISYGLVLGYLFGL